MLLRDDITSQRGWNEPSGKAKMLPSQLLRGRKTHSSIDRPQKTPADTVRLSFLNMDATLGIKEQNPYIY